MASVFINYRRADSAAWANKLFGSLSARYGKDLIFEDVESLPFAGKWKDAIIEEIRSCNVFLILIGPDWLGQKDAKGQRRIDDDTDVLRSEICEALNSQCTVIPVLLGDAQLPSPGDLPESIAPLTQWQAVRLGDDTWNEDVKSLVIALRDLIQLTRDNADLKSVQQKAYQMQLNYFELLEKEDSPAGALESAQKMSRLLDRYLPLFPYDPYLKVCRGYSLKNQAMALHRLGRTSEFGETLGEAEHIFRAMRSENPQDADAWNGSASIEGLRGNYTAALEYLDKCLEISPGHQAGLHDKQEILKRMGRD